MKSLILSTILLASTAKAQNSSEINSTINMLASDVKITPPQPAEQCIEFINCTDSEIFKKSPFGLLSKEIPGQN